MLFVRVVMLLPPDSPEYRKAQRQHLKATKNRPATIDQDWTPFRASEKKYKARFPPPDLSSVLDLTSEGHWVGSSTAFDYVNVALDDSKAVALSRIPGE
jgi:alkylated DNA repair protein alkB family protein 1